MTDLPLLSRSVVRPMAWPEKILQFGTGRFLRAFADFFVDAANRQSEFQGRIVVVQSTGNHRANLINAQDGLYTLWVRGLNDGVPYESQTILSPISRALSAHDKWHDVLACARSRDLEIILSNTTEVGLTFDTEDCPSESAPRSFPGKLTAVLYQRALAFDYSPQAGLAILPCELLTDNGDKLKRVVLRTARHWQLGEAFINWVEQANTFCNTLVDRIVPGLPPDQERAAFENRAGYRDELLTVAEDYRLWAIEGDETLRRHLAFASCDPGIVVVPHIAPYRTRKIRLLNGGHTLSVPVGILAGNTTVLDNMTHPLTASYIEGLLRDEIGPTLDVDPDTVPPYIDDVLRRWRNPYLVHNLIDITLHGTRKMRVRAIPSLVSFHSSTGRIPQRIALGFAAHLLFMRGVSQDGDQIYGKLRGVPYPINDTKAEYFMECWAAAPTIRALVERICGDEELWGLNLRDLSRFARTVADFLHTMLHEGMGAAIASCNPHEESNMAT